MSSYCYRTGTRTDTSVSTSFVRSTSYRTSIFTVAPTGTQLIGRVTTSRIPSVTSFPTEITRRSTYYKTTCTTYRTSGYTYPNYGYSRGPLSTGLIAIIVVAGLWYAVFFAVCIYLLCFSKTAKRGRRPKGQGGFSQTQYQNPQPQPQQQQYTPVPQDPLYSRTDTQYPPPSNSPYGGSQNSYNPYQNYNPPNMGGIQGPNQYLGGSPAAASFASGPGPGYIPPGAANPMLGTPSPGTISYSMSSTTPSPPPQGAGSDPHRLLYNQQNDRLSAAVSLVHTYQPSQEQQLQQQQQQPPSAYPTYQQSQEQPALSSAYPTYQQSQEQQPPLSSAYPTYQQPSLEQQPPLSSYPAPGQPFGQPQQTPSQTQLAAQYRGYAEPSTLNQNYGRV